jgi:hypothetical protein
MAHKSNDRILKTYIKHVISEKFLRIDNDEYFVTASQLKQIKTYLDSQAQTQGSGLKKMSASFTIEDAYKEFLADLGQANPQLASAIDSSVRKFPDPASEHLIKRLLVDSDILKNPNIGLFQSKPSAGSTVSVPPEVLNISEFSYAEKAGAMRGKGEFLIPLLFRNSTMMGGNDLIDVVIGGDKWHVKARTTADGSKGARMGSAPNVVFSSTEVYRDLVKSGISSSTFGEMGMQKFRSELPNFVNSLLNSGDPNYAGITADRLYDTMSSQAVEAAMVPGSGVKGICFYEGGQYNFVGRGSLYLYGTTQQGRIILSYDSTVKQKILGSAAIRSGQK